MDRKPVEINLQHFWQLDLVGLCISKNLKNITKEGSLGLGVILNVLKVRVSSSNTFLSFTLSSNGLDRFNSQINLLRGLKFDWRMIFNVMFVAHR